LCSFSNTGKEWGTVNFFFYSSALKKIAAFFDEAHGFLRHATFPSAQGKAGCLVETFVRALSLSLLGLQDIILSRKYASFFFFLVESAFLLFFFLIPIISIFSSSSCFLSRSFFLHSFYKGGFCIFSKERVSLFFDTLLLPKKKMK